MVEFWLKNPLALFKSCSIIPTNCMTLIEKLNALTRLVILITLILVALQSDYWLNVLVFGLLFIIVVYLYFRDTLETFHGCPKSNITEQQALDKGIRGFDPNYDTFPHGQQDQPCWFNQNTDLINATYEVTPKLQFNHDNNAKRSYMNTKYELTPLTDTDGFRQIWRAEGGQCGDYTMIPDILTQLPVEEIPTGQCNYITRNKIDHIPPTNTGLMSTRAIAEADYLQSTINFRDALMGSYSDRMIQERKHNCVDMKLNRATAGSGNSA